MATKPFEPHKAIILERVLRAWEKCQGSTLGELIEDAGAFSGKSLSLMNDQELCDTLERFALLGTKNLEDIIPEPITATKRISEQIRAMCYHRLLRVDCEICRPK